MTEDDVLKAAKLIERKRACKVQLTAIESGTIEHIAVDVLTDKSTTVKIGMPGTDPFRQDDMLVALGEVLNDRMNAIDIALDDMGVTSAP